MHAACTECARHVRKQTLRQPASRSSLEVDLSVLVEVELLEDLVYRLLSHVAADDQLQVSRCKTRKSKQKVQVVIESRNRTYQLELSCIGS